MSECSKAVLDLRLLILKYSIADMYCLLLTFMLMGHLFHVQQYVYRILLVVLKTITASLSAFGYLTLRSTYRPCSSSNRLYYGGLYGNHLLNLHYCMYMYTIPKTLLSQQGGDEIGVVWNAHLPGFRKNQPFC